jgi:hypothetical protein
MDKNQTSQRAHAGVLSSNHRQPLGLRLLLVALLLVLSMMSLQSTAFAQDCFQQCQRGYVECLNSAIGDDVLLLVCDDQYDDCAQGCL